MKTGNLKQNVALKYHISYCFLSYSDVLINTKLFIFTDPKSFEAVDGYVRQVREERHDNVAILILGNKVDLQVQMYSKLTCC